MPTLAADDPPPRTPGDEIAPPPPATQLCLVHDQVTSNLTPLLDPACAPRRVILAASPRMDRQARWLETVIRARGLRIERFPIADDWDLERLQLRFLELLEGEGDAVAARDIALNVSGGTKALTLAAFDAFRAYDLPIFYVDPERDRLVWLHPSKRPSRDLADRVQLDAFLLAHGAHVESRQDHRCNAATAEVTQWLAADAGRNPRAIATLNWLAKGAEDSLVSPEMDRRQLRDHALQHLLDRLAGAGLLRIDARRLTFPDEAARFYANGGWLEIHVFETLCELRGEHRQIQDIARSLDITRETPRGDTVPNEIDCACLADNRLHLIECKTRRWRDGGGTASPGAEALYRLDTLADLLGGLRAAAMLVSYQDLPDHDRRRAADLGIALCAGRRLPELAAMLRDWLAGGR